MKAKRKRGTNSKKNQPKSIFYYFVFIFSFLAVGILILQFLIHSISHSQVINNLEDYNPTYFVSLLWKDNANEQKPTTSSLQYFRNISKKAVVGLQFPRNVTTDFSIIPKVFIKAQKELSKHPMNAFNASMQNMPLEDIIYFLQSTSPCSDLPIFLSMASVGSDLYWQLIENYIYTMVKFELIQCTLMICVSDNYCMKKCQTENFPCFDYQYAKYFPNKSMKLPSPLEQIAALKLYHIPKALQKGVSIMTVDLDVGFLSNPLPMIQTFMRNRRLDVSVQQDLSFIMNRTVAGWKTWWTVPLPNIGLFLCKGNPRTVKMFEAAWKDYLKEPLEKSKFIRGRDQPGKDQNKVVKAMLDGKSSYGLRWSYIHNNSAVLLDKIFKFKSRNIDLGGQASMEILAALNASAVHTTCYEQQTKVMGLKAANAYWNPLYYHPFRPTLTKQLVYQSPEQLQDELRSLLWLCHSLNMSLILPNLLGPENTTTAPPWKSHVYWPGFRLAYIKKNTLNVPILEPAFYWRVLRDYSSVVPEPLVMHFSDKTHIRTIRDVLSDTVLMHPRIVLQFYNSNKYSQKEIEAFNYHNTQKIKLKTKMINTFGGINQYQRDALTMSHEQPPSFLTVEEKSHFETLSKETERVVTWAGDSVGRWEGSFDMENSRYSKIPSLFNRGRVQVQMLGTNAKFVVNSVRPCVNIFRPDRGNRSCFDKCD